MEKYINKARAAYQELKSAIELQTHFTSLFTERKRNDTLTQLEKSYTEFAAFLADEKHEKEIKQKFVETWERDTRLPSAKEDLYVWHTATKNQLLMFSHQLRLQSRIGS